MITFRPLVGAAVLGIAVVFTTASAAPPASAPVTVRDHLWLFAVPADGPRNWYESAGYRGGSRITPTEAAFWLDVPNLMFITQDWNNPPPMWTESTWKAKTTKEQYAISFEPLQRVQWAAVGSGGRGGLSEVPDIVTLAKKYPNFTGIFLDDVIRHEKRADGSRVARPAMTTDALGAMRKQLDTVGRPMEVWSVIYTHDIDPQHPDFHPSESPLAETMKYFDVITLWTWKSADLKDLEKNLTMLEAIKPKTSRIALGIYLWDYTGIDPAKKDDPTYKWGKPVPLDRMEHQCGLGLKWLEEGRISGMVMLGIAGIDQGNPSAPWMRDWIRQHGDKVLKR